VEKLSRKSFSKAQRIIRSGRYFRPSVFKEIFLVGAVGWNAHIDYFNVLRGLFEDVGKPVGCFNAARAKDKGISDDYDAEDTGRLIVRMLRIPESLGVDRNEIGLLFLSIEVLSPGNEFPSK